MRSHKILIAIVAILLLTFIAFAVYWWIAVDRLRQGIVDTRAQLAAFGIAVEHGEPDIGGFPFSLSLRLPAPVVTLQDGTRVVGPEAVEGRVWLWDLEHVTLEGPGRYEIILPGNELMFEAGAAEMNLSLAGGFPDSVSLALSSAVLTNRETAQSIAAERLQIAFDGLLPGGGGQDTAFLLDVEGLPLPPQSEQTIRLMGERIQHLRLEGRFEGPLFPGVPREVMATWRDAGGILDFETIVLDWGTLSLEGDGTVTLDDSFRPLGAFSFRTVGLPALVERMAEQGLLPDATVQALLDELASRAEGEDEEGRQRVTLPVTAQDGRLTMGGVLLGPFRPVF